MAPKKVAETEAETEPESIWIPGQAALKWTAAGSEAALWAYALALEAAEAVAAMEAEAERTNADEEEEVAAVAPSAAAPHVESVSHEGLVRAAIRLIADSELKSAAAGADGVADFQAVCEKLSMAPHPAMVTALGDVNALEAVTIRGWLCDIGSLCALLIVLGAHARVKTLRFWGCAVGQWATVLAAGLPASVTTLCVESEAAPDKRSSSQPWPLPLCSLPHVTALSLRCDSLGEAELAAMALALSSNAVLGALSLWGNAIGDAGAMTLSKQQQSAGTLKMLNVGCNRLGLAGAACIAQMLEPCGSSSLLSLDLSSNPLGNGLADVLVGPLKRNTRLTALNLRGTRIDDAAKAALIEAVTLEEGEPERPKPLFIHMDPMTLADGGEGALADAPAE